MYWNDLNTRFKTRYGRKVYKLSLSSGCSCPNRDGTLSCPQSQTKFQSLFKVNVAE